MKPVKVNPLAKGPLGWLRRLALKSDAFSFNRKVEEAKNVLICMPANVDRFAMARDLLSTFAHIFRPKKVFVLLPFLGAEGYLSDSPSYRVICTQGEDLNFLSLPRKKFVQRLNALAFDISVDLDIEDGFFNRYLCFKCKIPLRIGPRRKNAFPFYNIQLAVLEERLGSRGTYEGMAETLRTLFSSSGRAAPNPV